MADNPRTSHLGRRQHFMLVAATLAVLLLPSCSAAGWGSWSLASLLSWGKVAPARQSLLSPLSAQHPELDLGATEPGASSSLDDISTVWDPTADQLKFIPGLAEAASSKHTVLSTPTARLVDGAAGDGTPSSLDLEQAKRMGMITSVAYCSSEEVIQAWNCTRCKRVPNFQPHKVVFDQVWDLLAFVGYDVSKDAVVVAFRGTDSHNWGNWINNLKAWRANKMYPAPGHPGAMVHAGFHDLWTGSCLQTNLTELVGEVVAAHPTGRLFITGHSMGAALGSLAALDLKFRHNFTEVRQWSFGSPRVGNYAWQQTYEEHVTESWRFTHNRDVVPSLPPRLLGFHHVSREAWTVDFSGSGGIIEQKVLICDETGEDPSCHNSACTLGLCTSVADHLLYLGLEMYKDALEC